MNLEFIRVCVRFGNFFEGSAGVSLQDRYGDAAPGLSPVFGQKSAAPRSESVRSRLLGILLHGHPAGAGSDVRYLVEKPDGRFVMLLTLGGCSPPTTYAMATPDAVDAHDFGSRAAADAWIRANGSGKVAEMTDAGYWPLTD